MLPESHGRILEENETQSWKFSKVRLDQAQPLHLAQQMLNSHVSNFRKLLGGYKSELQS